MMRTHADRGPGKQPPSDRPVEEVERSSTTPGGTVDAAAARAQQRATSPLKASPMTEKAEARAAPSVGRDPRSPAVPGPARKPLV